RHGLRTLLEAESDLQVVGEAGAGDELVILIEHLRPRILLLDLAMPGLDGFEVAQRLREIVPETRIIILSIHADEAYVWQALRLGVAGYVMKHSHGSLVVRAVREVASGQRYLSPPLSEALLQVYAQKVAPASLDPYDSLTQREREVLHHLAESLTSVE